MIKHILLIWKTNQTNKLKKKNITNKPNMARLTK